MYLKGTSQQAPDWLWAKATGETGDDHGYAITTDASGNVYTTGQFYGTVDFDPGVGVFNLTGWGEMFISKLDDMGNFVWAKAVDGLGNENGYSIAVDPSGSGDVYTTGQFYGTVDFDPGADTFNLISAGLGDIFISKLDDTGNFVWAKSMGGINKDEGSSIAVDASGYVYATGYFRDTADFDPGLGIFNLNANWGSGLFISKLDNAGNFVWAKAMGDTATFGRSIAVDASGNVYTTGYSYGTVDFDPGGGTFIVTSDDDDIFISKLDSSGNFVWTKVISGSNDDEGRSIALDASGNVYITGYFGGGTVDFDPDSSGIFNLNSTGSLEIFISKLNSAGNLMWAKAIGGTSGDQGFSIAVDASGNVYTTGYFRFTADFNHDSFGNFSLTSAGNEDIFISKLDSSGNFVWAKAAGGTKADFGTAISPSASDNVHVTGYFESPFITFDSITFSNADTFGYWGNFTSDIFIAKLDNMITGIESVKNINDIFVFPNPSSNEFTLQLESNTHHIISISNTLGEILLQTETNSSTLQLEVSYFTSGVYFVTVGTLSDTFKVSDSFTKKFVKM